MAKREVESTEERDETQRSLGCVGASAIAHVGLLIAVALAPSFKVQTGEPSGQQPGLEFTGEQTANAAPSTAANGASNSDAPAASSQTSEVMLADSNDANAVELPASQTVAPAPVEKPAEQPPVEQKAKPVAAVPVIKKSAKAPAKTSQPAQIAEALKAARVQAAEVKQETKPEPKSAAVETAAAPGQKAIETSPAGDVETQSAPDKTTPTEATEAVVAEESAPTKQIIAANEAPAKDENQPTAIDQTSDEEDDEDSDSSAQGSAVVKKDEAVPLKIALPESEAISDEEANALQAPPTKKPAAQAAVIPSNATPITTVDSTRTNSGFSPGTGHSPIGSQVGTKNVASGLVSSGSTNGSAKAPTQGSNSRGAGAGYSVSIGVPVRDARTLTALSTPKPVYPLSDKLAGRQGTTVLVGKVKNDGSVENVTLEKSSGSKLMDDSAAQAFKSWKYKPGQEGYVRLPVQFVLVGDAKIIPAQLKRQ